MGTFSTVTVRHDLKEWGMSEPTPRTDEIEVAAYEDSEYGRRIVDVADYVAMTELSQQFERTLAAQRTALQNLETAIKNGKSHMELLEIIK